MCIDVFRLPGQQDLLRADQVLQQQPQKRVFGDQTTSGDRVCCYLSTTHRTFISIPAITIPIPRVSLWILLMFGQFNQHRIGRYLQFVGDALGIAALQHRIFQLGQLSRGPNYKLCFAIDVLQVELLAEHVQLKVKKTACLTQHLLTKVIASPLAQTIVRILVRRQDCHPYFQRGLLQDVPSPQGCLQSGFVPVIADDYLLCIAAQQSGLHRGEGGSE